MPAPSRGGGESNQSVNGCVTPPQCVKRSQERRSHQDTPFGGGGGHSTVHVFPHVSRIVLARPTQGANGGREFLGSGRRKLPFTMGPDNGQEQMRRNAHLCLRDFAIVLQHRDFSGRMAVK